MTSRTEAEGISSWAYDSQWIGALSSETGGVASKAYFYDTFGRVKSAATTINGQAYNVSTSYDNIGRVNTITYPTGLMIQRNYNAFGFLQSVNNAASGAAIWQANTVDEFGRTVSESFGNGVVTTHVYDNVRGVLTGLQSTSGGTTIQNWLYDYDAVGNMKFRTDAVVGYTERFRYDNLNRLTSVRDAGGVLQKSYAYNAIGNITFKSDVGSYAYDPYHPHAVATAGNNSYAYDANGNQTSGAGRSFTWTSFNKPSGISTANGYTGFAYDANHNRVLKTTPNTTTAYIGKIYQQTTMNGIIKDVSHIYAGSKLVASIEEVAGLSTINYMHGDHLGSISVITDANGAVIERLRFDVFGAPVNLNGTTRASFGANNTDRGYTGHEMDASTGLINMNARLYDPVLGRFISTDTIITDPSLMQDFNRYSYVLNNPLAYTDPSGHSWWTSFRNSYLVPFARQVTTVVIAAVLVIGSGGAIDPYTAMMIGGFTSSAIFGGNLGENVTAGVMSAISFALGNSELPSAAKGLLQAGMGTINNGAKSRASPAVSSQIISGANTVTGSGFQTAAFARLVNDENQIIREHLTLLEANKHYRNGGGDPLTIDASGLLVKRITSWRNGLALARVQGVDFLVHGTVTLQMDSLENITIREGLYNFDIKPWEDNVMRNIETIGAHAIAGSGTPYMIYYEGSPNVIH